MRTRIGLLWLLFASLQTSAAAAQTAEQLERAKASFKAGATAYAAGQYPAAIQALEAAYALTPLSAIAFSLAQAERREFFVSRDRAHLERAVALFRRYVSEVPHDGRSADALDALSQLEPLQVQQPAEPGARPAVSERPTRLMITCEASAAGIRIDDSAAQPTPLIREVTPGAHHVVVEADGYFPAERTVTAVAGELILSELVLRERPASLLVSAASDAELYVDGSFVSHGGPRVALSLASGPHTLTVAQPGHRTTQRGLTLSRGQTLSEQVALEPTLLHQVTRAMFVVGGVALAGGIVFGALAYRNQRRAEQFLDDQKVRNVTTDELSDYRDMARGRDRLRIATGVSLASAALLVLSALISHELDRPRATEAPQVATLRLRPQLQLSPGGAQAGGTLALRF